MYKSKSTKKALIGSIISLTLCAIMLIGTTFAWFTDTASVSASKIVSGKLDVDLEMKNAEGNWVSAEGQTLEFKKAAGAATGEAVLWEPGCTYELPELRVVNKGDLALKYTLQVTGIDGDAKLNEVIDWTVNDIDIFETEGHLTKNTQSDPLIIKGHMREDASNDYKGLSITGIGITVKATQDTVEYDSYGNQYDTAGAYPEITNWVEVSTYEQLKTAVNNATASAPVGIKLTNNLQADERVNITNGKKIVIDMNGHNIDSNLGIIYLVYNGSLDFTGKGTVSTTNNNNPIGIAVVGSENSADKDYSNLVVGKDVTISASKCIAITYFNENNKYGVNVTVHGTLNASNIGVDADYALTATSGNIPEIILSKTSVINSQSTGINTDGYAKWNLAGTINAVGTTTSTGTATGNALPLRQGKFSITGGTYRSNGVCDDPAEGYTGSNFNSGSAITLASDDSSTKKLIVNISGGTFISDNSYGLLECIGKDLETGNNAAASSYTKLKITGGTFKGAAGAIKLNDMAGKANVVSGGTTDSRGAYVISAKEYTVR